MGTGEIGGIGDEIKFKGTKIRNEGMRDTSLFLRNLVGCEKYGKRPWKKSLVTN